jgi:hypothetical protein
MAGNSGAVRAGRAFVELFTDKSKLAKGLKDAGQDLKSWGSSVSAIGAKIFAAGLGLKAALSGAAAIFAETGAGLAHMSERTGVSVEALSQLSYAADQTGVDMEGFEKSLGKMQQNLGHAMIGDEAGAKGFDRLGLSIQKLAKESPEQQLMEVAEAIRRIPDPAERAAAATDVFGKAGKQLLPFLMQGKAGITGLMKEADRLGLTMSAGDAAAAEELERSMKGVWATLKGAAVAIGSALAPAMTELVTKILNTVGTVVNWIKENKGLIVTISTIATGIVAAGAAMMAVGYVISAVGGIVAGLGTVVGTIGAVIGSVFTGAVGVIVFLLSPIGLVIAAIVALGAYVVYSSGIIGQALSGLSDVFGQLSGDFKIAFDAIKAALSAGDFAAAAKVLWAALKLEWLRGINYINSLWVSAKTFVLEIWSSAGFQIAEFFDTAFSHVEEAWETVTSAMGDGFRAVVSTLSNIWNKFIGFLASMGARIVDAFSPLIELVGGDVDALKKSLLGVKDASDQHVRSNDQAYYADKAQRQQSRQDRTAQIQQEREQSHANYQKAFDEQMAQYEKAKQDALNKGTDEAEQNLATAKAALVSAAAAAKSADHKTGTAKTGKVPSTDDIEMQGKTSVMSTFSPFQAAMLGTGRTDDFLHQIAGNTRDTNESVKKIKTAGMKP